MERAEKDLQYLGFKRVEGSALNAWKGRGLRINLYPDRAFVDDGHRSRVTTIPIALGMAWRTLIPEGGGIINGCP